MTLCNSDNAPSAGSTLEALSLAANKCGSCGTFMVETQITKI